MCSAIVDLAQWGGGELRELLGGIATYFPVPLSGRGEIRRDLLEGGVSWSPAGWLLGKVTEYVRVSPFRNCPWVPGIARQPCWGGQYRLALVHPPPAPHLE